MMPSKIQCNRSDEGNRFADMESTSGKNCYRVATTSLRDLQNVSEETAFHSGCSESGNFQLILNYDQLQRLRSVLETPVAITGRPSDGVPTLNVRPRDIVSAVRDRLSQNSVRLRDIRLNGGAASYILGGTCAKAERSYLGGVDEYVGRRQSAEEDVQQPAYNDLDIIFRVDLLGAEDLVRIRDAVLSVLPDFVSPADRASCGSRLSCPPSPSSVSSLPPRSPSPPIVNSYVHKMVKIYSNRDGGDRWSLISLSNVRGRSIELKFADVMRRQFQFSVDSFQIVLDGLLAFYDAIDAMPSSMPTHRQSTTNITPPLCGDDVFIDETLQSDMVLPEMTTTPNFYPTVRAESAYGQISDALDHLRQKLIVTRRPEEIRGGGLLKYCNLLVRGFRPPLDVDVARLERYMTSRFLIDFPRATDQRLTLDNYLAEHFVADADRRLRLAYLSTLYRVIESSTVQPMTMGPPERLATLHVIRQMSMHVMTDERFQHQQQRHSEYLHRQQQQQHHHHHGHHQHHQMEPKHTSLVKSYGEIQRATTSISSPSNVDESASIPVSHVNGWPPPPPLGGQQQSIPVQHHLIPITSERQQPISLPLVDAVGNPLVVAQIYHGPFSPPRAVSSYQQHPSLKCDIRPDVASSGADVDTDLMAFASMLQCPATTLQKHYIGGGLSASESQFFVVQTNNLSLVSPSTSSTDCTETPNDVVASSASSYQVPSSPTPSRCASRDSVNRRVIINRKCCACRVSCGHGDRTTSVEVSVGGRASCGAG